MRLLTVLAWVIAVANATPARSQPSLEVVHAFKRGPAYPAGPLLEASNGLLYGTTVSGGAFDHGTVFTIARNARGTLPITPIHSFTGGGGREPETGLIEVDGFLYGTTTRGGTHDYGTVFKMTFAGVVTTLHSFTGVEGAYPGALMRALNGELYGVTIARLLPSGGLPYTGTLFKITTAGGFTDLFHFSPSGVDLEDGAEPRGPLVQASDGTFYGVTYGGGSWSETTFPYGTIFKFSETAGFTRLHSFSVLGYHMPSPNLVLTEDGSLYATATQHGTGDQTSAGAVFRRAPDGSVTYIHAFAPDEETGSGGLQYRDTDGTFVGTLRTLLFRLTPTGTLTTIRRFSPSEGIWLQSVIKAADNRLYGLAREGGLTERGTVFAMTAAGDFTGFNPMIVDDAPAQPVGRLVSGADGSVFGVTCRGGLLNLGAVYKRSPGGAVTTLHSFFGLDGACPYALIRASDGFFYGVAVFGGLGARGTLFRMNDAGSFNLVHTFAGPEPAFPYDLMQSTDGQIYGTTVDANGAGGTIFKVTAGGGILRLHSFGVGCKPQLGVFTAGGILYATTDRCGEGGTLFRMTAAGAVTTLHNFGSGAGGGSYPGPLMRATDGRLYGTVGVAQNGPGAMFVSDLAGTVTPLHTFVPAEGQMPAWGLLQAHDGLFYGTTFGASPIFSTEDARVGTVFSATASGSVSLLHTFVLPETGGKPSGPLTQTPDGAIFGTALRGGPGQQGVLFRLLSSPGAR